MRAIYKLCGIEDREPAEIALDLLASVVDVPQTQASSGVTRLRVRNTSSKPLELQIGSPNRQHQMLSGECIELVCHVDPSGLLEIDLDDKSLIVRIPTQK
jgi:hypothetical protein